MKELALVTSTFQGRGALRAIKHIHGEGRFWNVLHKIDCTQFGHLVITECVVVHPLTHVFYKGRMG
jgi:hypothetical protein